MTRIDRQGGSGLLSVTHMGMRKASTQASRKCSCAIAFALVVLLIPAAQLCAMPRAERHETRHQIEHLEDAWRTAVLKGNTTAMDALLADDYIAISPNGVLQSKEQALASLRSGSLHFKSLELSDRKIRMYGTTALVTSRAEVNATGPDGALTGSYRYTRVYVKDSRGVWRIVSFEASKIRVPGQP